MIQMNVWEFLIFLLLATIGGGQLLIWIIQFITGYS